MVSVSVSAIKIFVIGQSSATDCCCYHMSGSIWLIFLSLPTLTHPVTKELGPSRPSCWKLDMNARRVCYSYCCLVCASVNNVLRCALRTPAQMKHYKWGCLQKSTLAWSWWCQNYFTPLLFASSKRELLDALFPCKNIQWTHRLLKIYLTKISLLHKIQAEYILHQPMITYNV